MIETSINIDRLLTKEEEIDTFSSLSVFKKIFFILAFIIIVKINLLLAPVILSSFRILFLKQMTKISEILSFYCSPKKTKERKTTSKRIFDIKKILTQIKSEISNGKYPNSNKFKKITISEDEEKTFPAMIEQIYRINREFEMQENNIKDRNALIKHVLFAGNKKETILQEFKTFEMLHEFADNDSKSQDLEEVITKSETNTMFNESETNTMFNEFEDDLENQDDGNLTIEDAELLNNLKKLSSLKFFLNDDKTFDKIENSLMKIEKKLLLKDFIYFICKNIILGTFLILVFITIKKNLLKDEIYSVVFLFLIFSSKLVIGLFLVTDKLISFSILNLKSNFLRRLFYFFIAVLYIFLTAELFYVIYYACSYISSCLLMVFSKKQISIMENINFETIKTDLCNSLKISFAVNFTTCIFCLISYFLAKKFRIDLESFLCLCSYFCK